MSECCDGSESYGWVNHRGRAHYAPKVRGAVGGDVQRTWHRLRSGLLVGLSGADEGLILVGQTGGHLFDFGFEVIIFRHFPG